jgi:hypothetical protein
VILFAADQVETGGGDHQCCCTAGGEHVTASDPEWAARAMNAYEGALHQAGVYRTDIRQLQGGRSGEAYDGANSSSAVFDPQWSTPDSRSMSQGQAMLSMSQRGQQPQEYSQESLISSYPVPQSDGNFTSQSWPPNAQAHPSSNPALAAQQALALAQSHAAAQANAAAGWTHPNMTAQDHSSNYSV